MENRLTVERESFMIEAEEGGREREHSCLLRLLSKLGVAMRRLLAVIDMQKDFIDGALGTPEAVAIVPRVRQVIAQARQEGCEVVFTLDTHDEAYLSTQEGKRLPVPHCVRGSDGWQLAAGLNEAAAQTIGVCEETAQTVGLDEATALTANMDKTLKNSLQFEKPTFGSTALAAYARAECFDEITLCGVCTDICVISNALLLKAFLPEATVRVLADACAGVTPESHETALAAMLPCQIEVVRG